MRLDALIADLSSVLVDGSLLRDVGSVTRDSRQVRPDSVFVAVSGATVDGHDFVSGLDCAAVVVERWIEGMRAPALLVPDTRIALGEIAAGWRRRFALPLIAVTGSNGKTTVKEMVASILAAHCGEDARLATAGNLNNDIGVPLTVLRLRDTHQAAVLELGMNRPGEIAWIASVAQPTVALVNNAQREHQEFMQSVEATAYENGASLSALPADGTAVFPGDDPHTALWRGLSGARRRIEFGLTPECAVHADPRARPEGFDLRIGAASVRVSLAIDGIHNVRNALAAAACATAIGIDPGTVAAGLAKQCQIQVAYAIGVAKPMNITVYTEGTGVVSDEKLAELINEHFDLRPKGIINMLNLLRPIYEKTAAYGHFGRDEPEFTWEATDKAQALRAAAGL